MIHTQTFKHSVENYEVEEIKTCSVLHFTCG